MTVLVYFYVFVKVFSDLVSDVVGVGSGFRVSYLELKSIELFIKYLFFVF